jgi:hypothetical protein
MVLDLQRNRMSYWYVIAFKMLNLGGRSTVDGVYLGNF